MSLNLVVVVYLNTEFEVLQEIQKLKIKIAVLQY